MTESPSAPARVAFAFPGVGVRPGEHEATLARRHPEVVTRTLGPASEAAGVDLVAALEGRLPDLTELQGQLLTYGFSCAVARICQEAGWTPRLVAGHSLGLYAALASTGALAFEDGLLVVEDAWRRVRDATADLDTGLAVIVGLTRAELDRLLADGTHGTACRVNANNDTTFVLAGLRADLSGLLAAALDLGALKARLLPVGAPYHHPHLLRGVGPAFRTRLEALPWRKANCPVVSSLDGALLSDPADLLALTARNLVEPNDWERVLEVLAADRLDLVVECGVGMTLTQNARLAPHAPPFATVRTLATRLGP